MSNLCYNCGDCHLPMPCPAPLKICDICGEGGHAYNFCPLSVRRKNPNYQFWALCHNCDEWHLPEPCKHPFVNCQQCGGNGHIEYFCPILPISRGATRDLYAAEQDAQTGMKRQRLDDEGNSGGATVIKPGAEMIRSIKQQAACDAIMLYERGVPKEFISHYIRRDPPQPSSSMDDRGVFETPRDLRSGHDPNVPQTPSTSENQDSIVQHGSFTGGTFGQPLPNINATPTPVPVSQDRTLPAPIPTSTITNTLYSQPQPLKSLDVLVYPKKEGEQRSISQVLEATAANGSSLSQQADTQSTTQAYIMPCAAITTSVQRPSVHDHKELRPAIKDTPAVEYTNGAQKEVVNPPPSILQAPTAAMKIEPKTKKPRASRKKCKFCGTFSTLYEDDADCYRRGVMSKSPFQDELAWVWHHSYS